MFRFRRLLHITFIIMLGSLLVVPVLATSGMVTDCSVFNDNNAGDGADTLGELLPGGGTISFTCGGTLRTPTTITISATTVLDATGQNVTLNRGNDMVGILYVEPGIRLELIHLTISGGRFPFINDQLTGDGAGLHNNGGTVIITNSTFSYNGDAAEGGAIFNDNNGTMTITDSTLSNNKGIFGGALANNSGTVTITGSTFTSNESYGAGGAVINDGDVVNMTITDSTFSGNHARGSAGAIQNHSGTGTMSISNTTVSGNSAAANAGGVDNEGDLTISYSTLSNNTAPAGQGGGLENRGGGTLLLINSIIANSVGGDCLNNGGTITLEETNLIEDGSCGALLRGDPKLGPLANNGGATFTHALLPGSLAVDAANGLCPTADQRGTLRPQGFGCDLGAFESPYVSGASAAPRRNLLATLTPTLNWEQIPFANGYKIQISSSSTFVGTAEYFLTDEVTVDNLSYTLPAEPPLSEGNIYYWRICAIGTDGLCHGWSAAETFVVDVP